MGISEEGYFAYFMKCSLNPDGTLTDVPTEFCEMLSYSGEELKGSPFSQLVHPDNRDDILALLDKIKKGESYEFEAQIRLLKKEGGSVSIFFSGMLVRNAEGDPISVACHVQNLTKLKKLEGKEQQFESLFKNNPHPVYYFDLEGNFRVVNDKLVEFTGNSREQLLGMNFEGFIVEEDLKHTKKQFEKAAAGNAGQYEIKVNVKEGEIRDIRVTKFPMIVGDEVTGVFGILQDITEEKIAKRKLEKSEQRFKSLFERNPDAVYSFDLEGNFVMANQALENLTGYSIEELKNLGFDPLVAKEDKNRVRKRFKKAARGVPQNYETSGIHKEGHRFYVQVTNLPIYVDGKIEGVFGIAHDITDRKKAERKLLESEQRWQQLVEQNPQPVQIVQDGKIVFINQVGAEYYGASEPKDLIGRSILDFTHPDNMDNALKRKEKLEQNQLVEPDEHKIVLINGEERYIEAHSIPISFKGEKAIQTVIHDISDLKEKQKVIGKSLKEKETLLQEIHHRVKNNLAMISSLLELQIMQSTEKAATNALRDSQLRIQSMAMIHEKLYQSASLHNIGFDEYLKDLVRTIKSTYRSTGKNIKTNFDLDHVLLDINQVIPCSLIVNEVVVNCYKHAFEHDGQGEIRIILKYDEPKLKLVITDDGKGLPDDFKIEEQQSLGMTLIRTLSDQLQGTFDLSTVPDGNGTIFQLEFEKAPEKF